jgi:hypothetical protein
MISGDMVVGSTCVRWGSRTSILALAFIGSSTSSQYRRGSSSTLIICHPPHSTSGLDLATRVCFCSIPLTLFLSLSFCSFSFAERASLGHAPLPGTAAGVYIHALCSLSWSLRHRWIGIRKYMFVCSLSCSCPFAGHELEQCSLDWFGPSSHLPNHSFEYIEVATWGKEWMTKKVGVFLLTYRNWHH